MAWRHLDADDIEYIIVRCMIALYVIGFLVDYSWYVAHGFPCVSERACTEGRDYVGGTVFGWIPAFFWPVHLLSLMW